MGCSQSLPAERPPGAPEDALAPGAAELQDSRPHPLPLAAPEDALAVRFGAALPPVKPFESTRFHFVNKLADTCRNKGSVDVFSDLKGGGFCAVKRTPKAWLTVGPQAFAETHGDSCEKPWTDIAIVQYLNSLGCSFACELVGVFADATSSYVVSSLASRGDLLAWSAGCTLEGKAREEEARPLLLQALAAVKELHDLGIAHRDISLENFVLHDKGQVTGGQAPQVKLIDYGMATISRHCPAGEVRGKLPCQAPEMHLPDGYDSFPSDVFALGVVMFASFFGTYPWKATTKGSCWLFDSAAKMGIKGWLHMVGKQEMLAVNGASLISRGCRDMLAGTLHFAPGRRSTLGEKCWGSTRSSVWDRSWLMEVPDEWDSLSDATTCDTLSMV